MTVCSRYEFAANQRYARRLMHFYAAMFDEGPVADLGAGRGFFLEALRDGGVRGVGVDISDEAAARCRELGFDIRVQDATTFLEREKGLAGVFASHLVEHLHPQAVERLLAASCSALRPGGTMIIVTPNLRDWRTLTTNFWLDPTHVRAYPPALLGSMLRAAGLEFNGSGLGPVPHGRREIADLIVGRLRFGRDYGKPEVWVKARRPARSSQQES